MLVEGSIGVDNLLSDGENLELEKGIKCKIVHTPGHSNGSISLLFEEEKSLITGDALALPGDIPIYEDINVCMASIFITFCLYKKPAKLLRFHSGGLAKRSAATETQPRRKNDITTQRYFSYHDEIQGLVA